MPSFDIASSVDIQTLDNAINVVKKYALVDISDGESQLVSISDKSAQAQP